ncbi:hypothetical protein LJC01_01110 [Clostridiaceae bacterium OttesenSCG-928-D20]|nr:hypothetical protein [Clostridiaceae bacterium OttesenSCG-928-D20]
MKRALSLILALAICLAFAGCKADPSPYEAFTKAMQLNSELTALESEAMLESSVSYGSGNMSFKTESRSKQIKHSEEDLEISMDMSVSVLGMSVSMQMYYRNNFIYLDAMGMKYKSELDDAEFNEQFAREPIYFSEEDIVEQSIEKTVSGYTASFLIKGEALKEYAIALLEANDNYIDANADYTLSDVQYILNVASNGEFQSSELNIPMSVAMGSEQGEVTLKLTETYLNTNSDVEITPPENLDDYTLTDDGSDFDSLL